MVVVSLLELAPIVVDEPDEDVPLWAVDDWLVVLLLPAVSVDGVVEPLLLVEPPEAVLGVAVEPVAAPAEDGVLEVVPPAPAAGELPVVPEPLVPEPDWAHARPKVPAMAAAMTVMLNVR
jgi:hypothetical protein